MRNRPPRPPRGPAVRRPVSNLRRRERSFLSQRSVHPPSPSARRRPGRRMRRRGFRRPPTRGRVGGRTRRGLLRGAERPGNSPQTVEFSKTSTPQARPVRLPAAYPTGKSRRPHKETARALPERTDAVCHIAVARQPVPPRRRVGAENTCSAGAMRANRRPTRSSRPRRSAAGRSSSCDLSRRRRGTPPCSISRRASPGDAGQTVRLPAAPAGAPDLPGRQAQHRGVVGRPLLLEHAVEARLRGGGGLRAVPALDQPTGVLPLRPVRILGRRLICLQQSAGSSRASARRRRSSPCRTSRPAGRRCRCSCRATRSSSESRSGP